MADANNVQHHLDKLQSAAEDLSTSRTMDDEQRAEAKSTAHQLAHALDQAEHPEAAAKAYEVIATLDHEGLPQPERLQQQVEVLAALLNG
ncbi:MAG: hypothetical protein ACRYF4_00545 [Janthinobacterium lividum]